MTDLGTRLNSLTLTDGPRTLADRVYGLLHSAIMGGTLTPGERLPIEELASALGTSPMPVRDALRRLNAVGLVENVAHRGARVREISIEDLEDVYTARIALESAAIRRTAAHFTETAATTASRWLQVQQEATARDDMPAAMQAHKEFHFALYGGTESDWVSQLIQIAWEGSQRYRTGALRVTQQSLDARNEEHQRLLDACVARDPDLAASELRHHLAHTANQVSRQISGRDLFPDPDRQTADHAE